MGPMCAAQKKTIVVSSEINDTRIELHRVWKADSLGLEPK